MIPTFLLSLPPKTATKLDCTYGIRLDRFLIHSHHVVTFGSLAVPSVLIITLLKFRNFTVSSYSVVIAVLFPPTTVVVDHRQIPTAHHLSFADPNVIPTTNPLRRFQLFSPRRPQILLKRKLFKSVENCNFLAFEIFVQVPVRISLFGGAKRLVLNLCTPWDRLVRQGDL